ncbi:DUF4381 domain-containing protein [Pseudoalteromonas sp. MMG010]|uniref:DUF4381 domain-containing protein n=1 Tax=Pseudoalteromonas sp. MMG010 TaxID=2822685 RepID=UPI001B39D692|nr:DUF4381 domain-containing protein [Pseudoalteromonas sp. MMG010]MBQ4831842.1 DUF4381 domain-containing protein [Pseudoalteromonas sp. MMG010]
MQPSPLDNLHDVIAPSQVNWWPLAPAWWVIIVCAFSLLILLIVYLYKQYQFKKPKRAAIDASEQVKDNAQQLHILLKRLAIHYYDKRLASQPISMWCASLKQLTGLSFSEQELLSLYASEQHNPQLTSKLHSAIQKFKLKEPINV